MWRLFDFVCKGELLGSLPDFKSRYSNIIVRVRPMCVCLCVCHNEKKVPCEWQARQATPAILQASSSKHNAKKIATRVRGPFHQSITAILTEEKREEKQFTEPAHVAVYLFRDLDRDGSRL